MLSRPPVRSAAALPLGAALALVAALLGALVLTLLPVTAKAPQAAAQASTGFSLRVGSYNIASVHGTTVPWRERRDRVANQILSRGLQVVGLQEANPSSVHESKLVSRSADNQYQDLLQALRAKNPSYDITTREPYNCAERGTNCSRDSAMSNRIVYRTDVLALEDKGVTRYAAQTRGKYTRYFEWALFQVRATGKRFLFTNTHLDPYTKANRPKQWTEALQRTAALRSSFGNVPVVSVGDYNTTKFSTWAKRMLPRSKSYGLTDVLGSRFQVNPGRPRAERLINGWLNSFNGWRRDLKTWSYYRDKRKQGNQIDWIFASTALRVTEYEVVAWVDKRKLRLRGSFPSDHNLVRATIVIP